MNEHTKEIVFLLLAINQALKASQSQINIVIVGSFNRGENREEKGWFDRTISLLEARSIRVGICAVGLISISGFVAFKLGYMPNAGAQVPPPPITSEVKKINRAYRSNSTEPSNGRGPLGPRSLNGDECVRYSGVAPFDRLIWPP